MNPLLPFSEFIPDVEARVFSDGKVYLYGSRDECGRMDYCSSFYNVYRSDERMERFEVFERIFAAPPGQTLYAPDCIEKDGRYYLYYCLSDGSEGVAVSNSPTGPFENLGVVCGVEKDGIDPAVFVDDDGQAYYFWGQFSLRGARLNPDMCSIDPSSVTRNILTEEKDGFHEGASLRKWNGLYILLYTDISRGRASCLSYATSDSPLGPYIKRGVILDNTGCDPETWNNHGSMARIGGEWYIFYHRASQNSR